jgi:predicted alpha/beta hydrolase family esterase
MSKIIIGIHGLGNKPDRNLLEDWWKMSLHDGLILIGRRFDGFRFHMTYWADALHPVPLDPAVKDTKSKLFIDEPYTKLEKPGEEKPLKLRRRIVNYLKNSLDKLVVKEIISLDVPSLTNSFIHYYFRDLEIYYSDKYLENTDPPALPKDVIRERLIKDLKKFRFKKICLIAHSMGSIIAYDVLSREVPDIKIDTFITIGSPLGQTLVMTKIKDEQNIPHDQNLKVPDNIKTDWYNFSDHDDEVAINNSLGKNFSPNAKNIGVRDISVTNNYINILEDKNPHKSYGYLRTPEVAEVVHAFLSRDESPLTRWLKNGLNKLAGRY